MWDALVPFVTWLGDSGFGRWLGQSPIRIAALFVAHLAGITLLLGGTLVLCVRLLGIGFRSGPLAQLARDVMPWQTAGLALALLSGSVIFTGGAASYYEGQWFRRKMTLLFVALLFHVTWFRAVVTADESRFSPWQAGVTAVVALLLWFGVGVAGRAIAFF